MKVSLTVTLLVCLGVFAVSAHVDRDDLRKLKGLLHRLLEAEKKSDDKTSLKVRVFDGSNDEEKLLRLDYGEKKRMLKLERDTDLELGSADVLRDGKLQEIKTYRRECYYRGANESGTFNLCGKRGVTGLFRDEDQALRSLQPVAREDDGVIVDREESVIVDRGLYEETSHVSKRIMMTEGTENDYVVSKNNKNNLRAEEITTLPPSVKIELEATVEYTLHQKVGGDPARTTNYILTLVNAMSWIFRTISTTPKFSIVLTNVVIIDNENDNEFLSSLTSDGTLVAREGLDAFVEHLKSRTTTPRYDHAMLFTAYDLCHAGSCNNVGLAFMNRICEIRDGTASSIVEDDGSYSSYRTAIHELAHNLGSAHDGERNSAGGPGATDCAKSDELMGQKKLEKFSACTIKQFDFQLVSGQAACLTRTNSLKTVKGPTQLPGDAQNMEKQCQAKYGNGSWVCPLGDDPCSSLYCFTNSGHCVSTGGASVGSVCDLNKKCFDGTCTIQDS